MSEIIDDIYYGNTVNRFKDYELERGDIGYLKKNELEERIYKIRFRLCDIKCWVEYQEYHMMNHSKKRPLIDLIFIDGREITIEESLDVFDIIMQNYYERTKKDITLNIKSN